MLSFSDLPARRKSVPVFSRKNRKALIAYAILEDVENREQEDPNDIDEMPIQSGAF